MPESHVRGHQTPAMTQVDCNPAARPVSSVHVHDLGPHQCRRHALAQLFSLVGVCHRNDARVAWVAMSIYSASGAQEGEQPVRVEIVDVPEVHQVHAFARSDVEPQRVQPSELPSGTGRAFHSSPGGRWPHVDRRLVIFSRHHGGRILLDYSAVQVEAVDAQPEVSRRVGARHYQPDVPVRLLSAVACLHLERLLLQPAPEDRVALKRLQTNPVYGIITGLHLPAPKLVLPLCSPVPHSIVRRRNGQAGSQIIADPTSRNIFGRDASSGQCLAIAACHLDRDVPEPIFDARVDPLVVVAVRSQPVQEAVGPTPRLIAMVLDQVLRRLRVPNLLRKWLRCHLLRRILPAQTIKARDRTSVCISIYADFDLGQALLEQLMQLGTS
eukprot:1579182-Rhodomonas_salina.1